LSVAGQTGSFMPLDNSPVSHVRRQAKLLIVTQADVANLSLIGPHTELHRLLERATVVSADAVPADIVTMNTEVILSDEGTRERRVVRVVYPEDADAARGLVSVLDALGTALLGASPGDVIELDLSDGPRYLRVESVVYQPEDSLRTHLVTNGSLAAGS
jgi:regulator of nucleoside diphosphate kinase